MLRYFCKLSLEFNHFFAKIIEICDKNLMRLNNKIIRAKVSFHIVFR